MPDQQYASVAAQLYGKDKVRLVRVVRVTGTYHRVVEYTLRVLLGGPAFFGSYESPDNSRVVATDTIKNTVYVLAKRSAVVESPELFADQIAAHFLGTYNWVDTVDVSIQAHRWSHIPVSTLSPGELTRHAAAAKDPAAHIAHPHAFVRDGEERRTVRLVRNRAAPARDLLRCGLADLLVLKTTGSSFENFHRDEYRTLPDASDRLFSTMIDVSWRLRPAALPSATSSIGASALTPDRLAAIADGVRQITLDIFANHNSPSVQHTLYLMGSAILKSYPEIEDISYALPNKHVFPVNLEPFRLENKGAQTEVYQPLHDPSGLITATITRKGESKI